MCVCVKFQLSIWSRTATENYSGPGGVGLVQSDYKAISVQLQLQLPTGTELGKKSVPMGCILSVGTVPTFLQGVTLKVLLSSIIYDLNNLLCCHRLLLFK